ncbi:MAG: DUF5343 domain-containing protein [Gallionella sp.]|nr:DUF5343 domain-containing protein [Gallionella sp.]
MTEEKKGNFPVIPNAHWWGLRKKFQLSIPGVVTDSYIAAVLNMQAKSARANILPGLKAAKIIDQDGKTLERAKRWRDDEQYPKVCKEIVKDMYPQELIDAVPDPISNRQAVERWFANHTGLGEVAVRKMVTFYTLLSEADPNKGMEIVKTKQTIKKDKKEKIGSRTKSSNPEISSHIPDKSSDKPSRVEERSGKPGIHINLQIHISADASSDQIDQIFSSMAKHIYREKI